MPKAPQKRKGIFPPASRRGGRRATLETLDRFRLWLDTMLIVWTDHGYSLGQHGCWAKNWMPMYEEVAHTPFFIFDPRSKTTGKRRSALVQPAIDLGPTLLDFFGVAPTADMTGKVLRPVIEENTPVRDAAIFGLHGDRIKVTDGRCHIQPVPWLYHSTRSHFKNQITEKPLRLKAHRWSGWSLYRQHKSYY